LRWHPLYDAASAGACIQAGGVVVFFGIEHGQNISFYSKESQADIALKVGMNFYTNGKTIHLLTWKKIPAYLFLILAFYKLSRYIAPFFRRPSLLEKDYLNIYGRGL
jgi:hypothetical protein